MASAVTSTLAARGSATTTVFIPRLHQNELVRLNDPPDGIKLHSRETMVAGQLNRTEPVLAYIPIALHMNMNGLGAIEADEEQAIRAERPKNSWLGSC
jgi:hypothetical protein